MIDSVLEGAARALALGDVLVALKYIALREDPPALALRGIAMAQLGEYAGARALLRRAARSFGSHDALARARCVVAEAEVALAMRDLRGSLRTLAAAAATLTACRDRRNALQAQLIAVRRLLLLGRIEDAARDLAQVDARQQPPALQTMFELATADVALRLLHTAQAREALGRAGHLAAAARVPALAAEVVEAQALLNRPAARRLDSGQQRVLRLDEVEAVFASDALVFDACRRCIRAGKLTRSLTRRPVLFALAQILAAAWPGDAGRPLLIQRAFATRRPNETHRARLRVELGRLRALVAPLARIEATANGFVLRPLDDRAVVVLLPPVDGEQASLVALLADGAAWSTSALALALGTSQRTVQRALLELEAAGQVHTVGRARAQRWLSVPLTGITTILLLPAVATPA